MREFYSPDIVNAARAVKKQDAHEESDRNRAAELHAQTRRLDRDRIIQMALDAFEHDYSTRYPFIPRLGAYLCGASGIETRQTTDSGHAYGLELLAEIRAGLSPLVKP